MGNIDETTNDEKKDVSEFKRLLAGVNAVRKETFNFPFYDRPITVYYKTLKSVDIPEQTLQPDFFDLPAKERTLILLEQQADIVFEMIQKAQKEGEVPDASKIDRETWDALRTDAPQAYQTIVGRISGLLDQVTQRFFGGPRTPESE